MCVCIICACLCFSNLDGVDWQKKEEMQADLDRFDHRLFFLCVCLLLLLVVVSSFHIFHIWRTLACVSSPSVVLILSRGGMSQQVAVVGGQLQLTVRAVFMYSIYTVIPLPPPEPVFSKRSIHDIVTSQQD